MLRDTPTATRGQSTWASRSGFARATTCRAPSPSLVSATSSSQEEPVLRWITPSTAKRGGRGMTSARLWMPSRRWRMEALLRDPRSEVWASGGPAASGDLPLAGPPAPEEGWEFEHGASAGSSEAPQQLLLPAWSGSRSGARTGEPHSALQFGHRVGPGDWHVQERG